MTILQRIRNLVLPEPKILTQEEPELIKEELQVQPGPEVIKRPTVPIARVSLPTGYGNSPIDLITQVGNLNFIETQFARRYISIIRSMTINTPDISQAFTTIIRLSNTAHEVVFDSSMKPEMQDKARLHLETARENWTGNAGGLNGIVNRLFSQLFISGATSVEWVPKNDLSGVKAIVMVDPESIYYKYNTQKEIYEPYQKVNALFDRAPENNGYVKLNPYTYKYSPLNGDQEVPYGYPPYLSALKAVLRQEGMIDDIDKLLDIMGLLGFLQAKVARPEQMSMETDSAYNSRCETFLDTAKKRIADGMRSGVIVGYMEESEFLFNATTKDLASISTIYDANEQQVISGVGSDPSLLGRAYSSGGQTAITIVFQKLLAEIQEVQRIVARTLEYGYILELRLAGFKFDKLTVKFGASTILDNLKVEQSNEIKIRNLSALYWLGVLSLEQVAQEMGYDKPDKTKPRIDSPNSADGAQQKSEKREKAKDANDKTNRRKASVADKKEAQ